MSIVEKALQKAHLKTGRTAARDVRAPEAPDTTQPLTPPRAALATPAAEEAARRPRPARGGPVVRDVEQLRRDGRLPPEALTHRTEEEFRRIKWPLLNSIAHREGARPAANNIVLVTSPPPREGKNVKA